MARSSERILTTQLGSLPRSDALLAMLMRIEKGEDLNFKTQEGPLSDHPALFMELNIN